jgi:hypothetical protein
MERRRGVGVDEEIWATHNKEQAGLGPAAIILWSISI